jgi:hypothetical protein
MQLSRPYRIALAILVLHPGPLSAQHLVEFVPIQVVSAVAPGNKTPVIADIELRTEAATPWGTITQTLTGKFWRSRDGKSRQDDTYGNTFLFSASTQTWVDHEAKSAIREVGRGFMFILISPAGSVSGLQFRGNLLGKKTIGDRTANGWGEDLRGNSRYEFWTDARLGVPLEHRWKAPGVESVQRLMNIEERDPDPKLFEIPEGYSVLSCPPSKRSGRPAPLPTQCFPRPWQVGAR